jgi:hypothetical protein
LLTLYVLVVTLSASTSAGFKEEVGAVDAMEEEMGAAAAADADHERVRACCCYC